VVQNPVLWLISFIAPLVLQWTINLLTVRSWWDAHNVVLGLVMSGSITHVVKITVGRPRPGAQSPFCNGRPFLTIPDLIARCIPPQSARDPTLGLVDWRICTQVDKHILRNGFKSFPSGHSSTAFAGLGFLSFYLAGKLHLFDERGHTGKAWISLAPFCGATLIAISRTMDYRHHWHDVLIGGLLGTALAFFSYRQYFPRLSSEVSHLPFSPRVKHGED
ncbi:PAP2-domain-containing protein, partial [Cylindrobasidium torrendii FP15055 ss-10]